MKTLVFFLLLFACYSNAQEVSVEELCRKIYHYEYQRQGIDELEQLTQHTSSEIRLKSLRALGHIQSKATIPTITVCLNDTDVNIRVEAAFALGQMWDNSSESVLLEALAKEKEQVVLDKIIEALGKTGESKTVEAFALLMEKKEIRDAITYASGLLAYRGIFSEELIKKLIANANDEDPSVRKNVSYALMRVKEPRTIHHLIQMLYDKSSTVRMNAARALGYIKDSKALPHLYLVLHDKDPRVVVNAIGALKNFEKIDAEKVLPLLSSENYHIATNAMQLCGYFKLHSAEAILCQKITTASSLYQGEILKALSLINPELFMTWLAKIENRDAILQSKIAEALGNVNNKDSFDYLIAMYETSNTNVQQMIISSLGKLKSQDTTKILEKSLETMDMAIVTYAAQALAQKKSQGSLLPLINTFEKMKLPMDIEAMQAIVEAVGSLTTEGNKKGISFLQEVAKSDSSILAKIAQDLLSELKIEFTSSTPNSSPAKELFSYEEIQNLKPFTVTVKTKYGDFIIRACTSEAPIAAFNFKKLIEKKFYDGLTFHRVVSNFVVQGGDPRGDGWGGPGYVIPCEYNTLRYTRGMVGMPLAGKDTGGCQLFITHSPQPHLNGKYTIFGEVVEGMDIVDKIQEYDKIDKMIIGE